MSDIPTNLPPAGPRTVLLTLKSGLRSLRTTLALYFIPLGVVPVILISVYATKVFEESTRDAIGARAGSEREAFLSELSGLDNALKSEVQRIAALDELKRSVGKRAKVAKPLTLPDVAKRFSVRVYRGDGSLLTERIADWDRRVDFLPADVLSQLSRRAEISSRYASPGDGSVRTLIRRAVRVGGRLAAVVEGEFRLSKQELAEIRARKQVDVLLINRDLSTGAASFALSPELVERLSKLPYRPGQEGPLYTMLGDNRYAVYLYELQEPFQKKKAWGYFALFLSMTGPDETVEKLKVAMVYLAALLVLGSSLLIFLFSNRIVEPIELLVLGMKRLKTGKAEYLPAIQSTDEIEYLVQSFNEMTRNVSETRAELEKRLQELARANSELQSAQGILVQNAKMASLGQLVAGVAHELNNPIGFIYGNMHHLSSYTERLRRVVEVNREARAQLPPDVQAHLQKEEEQLEIDFVLKDMVDLTRSCVDGAKRTKDIVLGLRTFSRMDETEFRSSDLREGIQATLRLLQSEFKDRVVIHEEYEDIPPVECNISQLNQVFMNLLSNAVHAVAGRGDVWVRLRRATDDDVCVEIEDNGAGISSDVVPRIFDPFFTTKQVGQGTGLGLSIAYGLIEKHHGSIEVKSEQGKGSLFIVRLPIRQPGAALLGANQAT